MTASVVLSKERPVASVRTKAWEKALARASIEDFTWHGLCTPGHPGAFRRVRHWRSSRSLADGPVTLPIWGVRGTKMAQSPLRTVPQSA